MANEDNLKRLKRGGREWNAWRKENPGHRPDLRDSNLSEMALPRINLSKANLHRANLEGANLKNANLSGANLSDSDTSKADLSDANISWANLSGANLSGTNFSRANLSGSNLSRAYLHIADLSGADLIGTDLSGADLSGSNLTRCDLSGADLCEANLKGANFKGARLKEANLSGAVPAGLVAALLELQEQQEEKDKKEDRRPSVSLQQQTIFTTTPLGDGEYSLSSLFLRLPSETTSRNEPVLTDALADMEGVQIIADRVASFEEMAEYLTPEDWDFTPFTKALRKALADECAVIAIRNPLINLGKDWLERGFSGGTVFTALTAADSPATFFAYVGTATAGLVILRIGRSVAVGSDTIIQAIANRIAKQIDPPPEVPTKAATRKKK